MQAAKKQLEEVSIHNIHWHFVANISKRPPSKSKRKEKIYFVIDETNVMMWEKIIYANDKHVTKDTNILRLIYLAL